MKKFIFPDKTRLLVNEILAITNPVTPGDNIGSKTFTIIFKGGGILMYRGNAKDVQGSWKKLTLEWDKINFEFEVEA